MFKTTTKQYDLFSLFIELSIALAKRNGVLSYIVPDSLIGRSNFEETRKLIIANTKIHKWLHINNVFESANVSSLIYVCQKTGGNGCSFIYEKAADVSSWLKGAHSCISISVQRVLANDSCKVIYAEESKLQILDYLKKFPVFDFECFMWRGEEVGKNDDAISRTWIAKNDILKDVPYNCPKLLIRQLGDSINATIDLSGAVTTQSVYSVLPKDSAQDTLYFYLGILNSKLFDFIYNLVSGDKQTFKRIILENIKALPLPVGYTKLQRKSLVSLVKERMSVPENQIAKIEEDINDLVFDLYGITEQMRSIISQA